MRCETGEWGRGMAKCISCGRKGFLLKVDEQGMCGDCAKVEAAEFEAHYVKLLSHLKSLQEPINVGHDPIAALEYIPLFKEKIEMCDVLQKEIHIPKYEKRFIKRIIDNITYRDDFSKRHKMGTLQDWGISVFADTATGEFSAEKIFADFDRQINSYRQRWEKTISRIQDSAEFQRVIDEIPSVEVKKSNTKFAKKSVSGLDELIKYTNITAKTSFDKIGSFVVIDVETTGLSSTRDSLLEIAAIRFEDWTPVEKFHTLINPGKHIPEEASAINNITDEMVADAPTFSEIIECLSSFIGKYSIVGHNLPFDLKFLYRYGYDFTTEKRRYYDTCEISKKVLKKPKMKWDKEYEEYVINYNYDYDVEDYKLTTLCEFYQIRDNSFAHRALSDALATGFLFKNLAIHRLDC